MARLIDAKALEKQIKESIEDNNPVLMGQMLRWVRKQTTIDAVPVVRCKDCHNRTKRRWCNLLMMDVEDEGFCSYGKRKVNGS